MKALAATPKLLVKCVERPAYLDISGGDGSINFKLLRSRDYRSQATSFKKYVAHQEISNTHTKPMTATRHTPSGTLPSFGHRSIRGQLTPPSTHTWSSRMLELRLGPSSLLLWSTIHPRKVGLYPVHATRRTPESRGAESARHLMCWRAS